MQSLTKLFCDANATESDYDLSKCIHELFEAQVEKTPDACAVIFNAQKLSYRELNACANQLAQRLQNLGVKPETLVGICVERSLEMVIGLLGILKAGGAYVPLDPGYPQERLAYMLQDSQVPLLLTQKHLIATLSEHQAEVICLDEENFSPDAKSTDVNVCSGVKPENLMYVIYTSGSTGKPKGVMNTHKGVCNRLLWMQEAYQLTAEDKVLQKTPFSFDVSVWEFFWTLITGATLVVAVPDGHRNTAYLVDLIEKEEITTLHFVPSMLQVFAEAQGLEKLQSLKRVICSGEALPVNLVTRFFSRLNCELHNLYGPTEAAIDVTFFACKAGVNYASIPIGKPIANTQIYILDSDLQFVPVGVAGELHIGGVGVARGYLNRPNLTDEKFIPNFFSNQPGERLYKTGDLARYLSDGNIEYIGRIDHQVKIRGFRIELGEVENALGRHPYVREAVAIASANELIAYIVPSQEKPTPSILREFLSLQLPDYMIPAAFVVLESLPLTPSGKVDRRSLPAPKKLNYSDNYNFIAPRNDVESQLGKIWWEILGLEDIGVKDNFFDLGGNSLKAIALIAKIEQQFHKSLPLSILLSTSTIEDLAKEIEKSKDVAGNSPLVLIQPKGEKLPFFCVHPAGGHTLCYANLARYVGREQPFYGLQAQGFYGDEEPLTRIEDMASLYIKAMQTVQRSGPYKIGGWSFGGVVAYEIAQQLQKQGEEVALLAVLDSYVPIILDKQKNIDNAYLVGVVCRVFGGMFGQDNLVEPQEIQHLSVEEQIDYIIDKAREVKIFPPGVEQKNNRRILEVLVGTLKATYSYKRQPYPGKVTIFRAQNKHIMASDPTLVWVELFSVLAAKEIEIHDVPGHHYSFVLEPHVPVLGESLKACLHQIKV